MAKIKKVRKSEKELLDTSIKLLADANSRLDDLHRSFIKSCTPRFTNELAAFKTVVRRHIDTCWENSE